MSNRYKLHVTRYDAGPSDVPRYVSETTIETTDTIPDLGRAARNLAGVFCLDVNDVDENDIRVDADRWGVTLKISDDHNTARLPWLIVELWKEEEANV